MSDPYLRNKHTTDLVTLEVKTFAINGVPVCMSWYGCDKHNREACQFLLQRHFGGILVCGLNGEDILQEADIINPVPESCPLHNKKREDCSDPSDGDDAKRGWTKDIPITVGYYGARKDINDKPEVVEILIRKKTSRICARCELHMEHGRIYPRPG